MIRILFILLAVVAAVLAFVLQLPELYVVAAVLVLLALVFVAMSLRQRHKKAKEPYIKSSSKEEELSALGIMEIRPRDKRAGTAAPVEGEPAPTKEGESMREVPSAAEPSAAEPSARRPGAPPAQAEPVQAEPAKAEAPRVEPVWKRGQEQAVAEKPRVGAVSVATAAETVQKDLLVPYLKALREAISAHTVCLLQHEPGSAQYHIEAIISQNAYARSQGSFSTRAPLLPVTGGVRGVVIQEVGEQHVPLPSLGYYRDAITVRQLALVPVARAADGKAYLLLADAVQEHGLDTPRQRALLEQFAQLLGALLDEGQFGGGQEAEQEVRPRRDIIAEEMAQARKRSGPLALALVYLNRAEAMAAEGAAALGAAEQLLEARVRQATPQGRVERFGELTYGVFLEAPIAEVEDWAEQLQRDLAEETGSLEGGVSIGVALLRERHQSPDALRDDATEALRAAYETGACTILE